MRRLQHRTRARLREALAGRHEVRLSGYSGSALDGLRGSWERLPRDLYLRDGVIHETTPLQSEGSARESAGACGVRDTLVLTYRARGFQEPGAAEG